MVHYQLLGQRPPRDIKVEFTVIDEGILHADPHITPPPQSGEVHDSNELGKVGKGDRSYIGSTTGRV